MTSIQIVPRRDLLAPNASSASRETVEAAYDPVYAAIAYHKYMLDMLEAVIRSYRPYDAPDEVERKGPWCFCLGARKIFGDHAEQVSMA